LFHPGLHRNNEISDKFRMMINPLFIVYRWVTPDHKSIHFFSIAGWLAKAMLFSLLFPVSAIADFSSEKWGAFLGGGLSTIVIHELGHMAVAEYHDIDYQYDGVTIIYPGADFTDSEHLRVASAGFQAQWIASEFALGKLARNETLTPNSRSFSRGIVAGHAAITFAYMTFLKDHDDGDIAGMSQASGLSNNELALLVAIPAVLDTWRLTANDVPGWVPNLSLAFKGLGLAAIWTF
jgi:hypothetical protein